MKKLLKISIAMIVMSFAMIFSIPTIQAEETTETITTEEVINEITEFDWQELKYKIQIGVIGFLSSATFTAIGSLILNILKKKALE